MGKYAIAKENVTELEIKLARFKRSKTPMGIAEAKAEYDSLTRRLGLARNKLREIGRGTIITLIITVKGKNHKVHLIDFDEKDIPAYLSDNFKKVPNYTYIIEKARELIIL